MKKFIAYVIVLLVLISMFRLDVICEETSSSKNGINIETEDASVYVGKENNLIIKLYGNNIKAVQTVLKIKSGDVSFKKAVMPDKYEYLKSIVVSVCIDDNTLMQSDNYEYFTIPLFAESECDFSITLSSLAFNMANGQRVILYQDCYLFNMKAIEMPEQSEEPSEVSSEELSSELSIEQSCESSAELTSESSSESLNDKNEEKSVYDNFYFQISSLTIIASLITSVVIIVRKKKKRIKPE